MSGNNMHKNTGNYEWYTPGFIIEAARKAMGGIDLDPASSEAANELLVKAVRYFSEADNGLAQFWSGRVWLNPPYSAKLVRAFVDKLIESGTGVTQACVLLNNITDTATGQKLLRFSDAVCFPSGRIRFIDASGEPAKTPMQGQMICGIGADPARFTEAFREIGVVLVKGGEQP